MTYASELAWQVGDELIQIRAAQQKVFWSWTSSHRSS